MFGASLASKGMNVFLPSSLGLGRYDGSREDLDSDPENGEYASALGALLVAEKNPPN